MNRYIWKKVDVWMKRFDSLLVKVVLSGLVLTVCIQVLLLTGRLGPVIDTKRHPGDESYIGVSGGNDQQIDSLFDNRKYGMMTISAKSRKNNLQGAVRLEAGGRTWIADEEGVVTLRVEPGDSISVTVLDAEYLPVTLNVENTSDNIDLSGFQHTIKMYSTQNIWGTISLRGSEPH